jgi:hypothetical protein
LDNLTVPFACWERKTAIVKISAESVGSMLLVVAANFKLLDAQKRAPPTLHSRSILGATTDNERQDEMKSRLRKTLL